MSGHSQSKSSPVKVMDSKFIMVYDGLNFKIVFSIKQENKSRTGEGRKS